MEAVNVPKKTLPRYLVRVLIVLLLVILLCAAAFIASMQIANIMVLAGEALNARQLYVMGTQTLGNDYLERFFTQRYIETGKIDELALLYDAYTVSSYNATAKVQWAWTMIGSKRGTAKIHESVKGILGERINKDDTSLPVRPPDWYSGVYEIKLIYEQERWLVDDIILLTADPTPTPDPSASPTPASGQETGSSPEVQGGVSASPEAE